MDVKRVLRSAATKTKAEPVTDMVEIPIPPGVLIKHREKYNTAKSAKADLALSEEELMREVEPQYKEAIKKSYVSSARLKGDGVEATASWKDAYTKIPLEREQELKDVVGAKFDDYFRVVNDIQVKPEIAEDEHSLAELIEAVGPEVFSKYFNVKQHIKPTTRFTRSRHKDLDIDANEQLDVTVRQHKPAVRVKV